MKHYDSIEDVPNNIDEYTQVKSKCKCTEMKCIGSRYTVLENINSGNKIGLKRDIWMDYCKS